MNGDPLWLALGNPSTWPGTGVILGVALLLGLVFAALAAAVLAALGRHLRLTRLDIQPELHRLRAPLLLSLPPVFGLLASAVVQVNADVVGLIRHGFELWLIAGVTWVLIRAVVIISTVITSYQEIDAADNLHARRIYTQIRFFQRALTALLVLLGVGAMLITFSGVRQIGVSLLASAGIAGIVIGFAAQRTLGALFAGLQIAIAQPIRIDDVLVVDGEWGQVEEITLTYVVVRTWDLRRLIVPITRLLEQSFQNWTRTSANLLGTVYLYLDYTAPVAELRDKLHEVLDQAAQWDRQVWNLQVTNLTDHGVELRALMSAANSGAAWDLRCLVRERLLEHLQQHHPSALPRVRLERVEDPTGRAEPDSAGARPD